MRPRAAPFVPIPPRPGEDPMKAKVDPETCIACGLCAEVCPEVFEMTDAGPAEAKPGDVPPEAEATCRQAADDCPVEAISIN